MNSQSTLSLCMIVKNEELMLRRCLKSVRDYVDEIIVVDTGSEDRTVGIAEEFGANVFHYKWENNFALHRNQAIGHSNKDWILVLDADEELKEGCGDILREAIKNTDIDSIAVTNISFFNSNRSEAWVDQIRVFRNAPGIHYRDIVHEQLSGITNTKKYPIFIHHYGYDLDRDRSQKKHDRNVGLIKRQIENDPDNFYFHLNLAVSYSTHFEFRKAVEEGLVALRLADQKGIQDDNVLWAKYIVSSAYLKLNDFLNAEQSALETISLAPEHHDSYFILAMVYHQKNDWDKLQKVSDKLIHFYRELKDSPENYSHSRVHMIREEWRIYLALGDLYLNKNDLEKAKKHFHTAGVLSSDPAECSRIIGDCYAKKGFQCQAESEYKASLARDDNPDASFGLARLYKNSNFRKGYREMMEKIDLNNATNPDIFFEKGLICLKEKDYDTSIDLLEKAVSLRPDFFHALQNLSLAYKCKDRLTDSLETGLKALELRPDSVDIRINLGRLCCDLNEFGLAADLFEGALEMEPDHFDVRLTLCEAYIQNGDLEKTVYECDQILKKLDLPRDIVLNSISDLADMFLIISDSFYQTNSPQLSARAEEIACLLHPRMKEKPTIS